ncbi:MULTISPECIES: type I toxin-antitoxin system Fst family toxin [Enterococcus]|uniref:Type I toxin-antitoxin system Fst family toxin n=1 Tax=Candidatus Enterococcus ferrettii TaxID=2815324 RepID=A0ABV0EJR5_9ENTE|nr:MULTISPECIES: type I toxin-antitoxin system Fst family toxin [Enterococcus]MBO1339014.1 type I toxin-antitoxin system Fst family toxin [Enterococcus sp. 665A]
MHPLVQYILAPILVGVIVAVVNHWLDDHDP